MAYLNSDCCCLHISSPSRGQKCLLQPTPIHPRSIGLQDLYIPLRPVHHMCGNCSFRLACDSLLGHYFELSCVYGGLPFSLPPPIGPLRRVSRAAAGYMRIGVGWAYVTMLL